MNPYSSKFLSLKSSHSTSLPQNKTIYSSRKHYTYIWYICHCQFETLIIKLEKMKKTSTGTGDSSKLDRKTIERNRRIHMKALCFKLVSGIPSNYIKPPKDALSQQDQLDLAATYIKHLRERVDKLKREKEEAMNMMRSNQNNDRNFNIGTKLPLLEMRDFGSGIEVMLVSGLNKNFMLYEVIGVLEEEGAEVVTANYSIVGDKVFYTVHARVKISRVGVETTRVYQRLHELIAPLECLEDMS